MPYSIGHATRFFEFRVIAARIIAVDLPRRFLSGEMTWTCVREPPLQAISCGPCRAAHLVEAAPDDPACECNPQESKPQGRQERTRSRIALNKKRPDAGQ